MRWFHRLQTPIILTSASTTAPSARGPALLIKYAVGQVGLVGLFGGSYGVSSPRRTGLCLVLPNVLLQLTGFDKLFDFIL